MNDHLKLAIFILGAGIVWGAYDFYDFFTRTQPKMASEIEAKRQSLVSVQKELGKLKAFAQGLQDTKEKLKKTNLEFEEALTFIPRNLDWSKLLAKLNQLARNSDVELESFKPGAEVRGSAAAAGAPADPNAFYSSVNLDLQLKGSYPQILAFLDQISRLKRILNVETVKMSQTAEPATSSYGRMGVAPLLTMVTLKTYRFTE